MQRIAYLNGEFLPLADARISPLDRGFLFADGIYEVVPFHDGRPFHVAEHVARLERGLAYVRIDCGTRDWTELLADVARRNGGGDLYVYLQVTRGAPDVRKHEFPAATEHTVFAMADRLAVPEPRVLEEGLLAVTVADLRWAACDVKAIALLPNVLARQQATDCGADDGILVRDGVLTETTSGNIFLVEDGTILTPCEDQRILPGVTRRVLLDLAAAEGIPCHETDLPADRLPTADEVWLSSTTRDVLPVTRVDERPIGDGRPGPLWQRMWDVFQAHKRAVCPPPDDPADPG